MLNKKRTAQLLVLSALLLSVGGHAFADEHGDDCGCDIKKSATTRVKACLQKFVQIHAGEHQQTCIKCDGDLDRDLRPTFKIKSNCELEYKLTAEVKTEGNKEVQAIFKRGGKTYIALGNEDHKPTKAACDNCKGNNPEESKNAEVIAYPIKIENHKLECEYGSNAIKFKACAGETEVPVVIDKDHLRETFGANDGCGEYCAELTLSLESNI